MEKLGIAMGQRQPAVFIQGRPRYITVRDGLVKVHLVGDMGRMPDRTVLSGQLFVRDRVFGRLTWATPPTGDSFPVCLEIRSENDARGMARKDGDENSSSSALIFTTGDVKAVPEFE
ncbi:hypothetical protein [Corallococcus terminator]|nr:hypothetical protein [Corallococcus terminator]